MIASRAAHGAVRGVALAAAMLLAAGALAAVVRPAADLGHWLCDVRPLGGAKLGAALRLTLAVALLFPRTRVVGLGALAALCTRDAVAVEKLSAAGVVDAPWPSASAVFAIVFAFAATWSFRRRSGASAGLRRSALGAVATCAWTGASLFAFTSVAMGAYAVASRPARADVAVVFGALVHADGTPSRALADRVRAACELYREGRVQRVVVSGGPGRGDVHETTAMRRLAIELGVAAGDVVVDAGGVSSRATVTNVRRLLPRVGGATVVLVSHGYHLPRLRMEMERQGLRGTTWAAAEGGPLPKRPWYALREVAAAWWYAVA